MPLQHPDCLLRERPGTASIVDARPAGRIPRRSDRRSRSSNRSKGVVSVTLELEITPAPPDDLREALERALEQALAGGANPSGWWAAGVRESVGVDDVED